MRIHAVIPMVHRIKFDHKPCILTFNFKPNRMKPTFTIIFMFFLILFITGRNAVFAQEYDQLPTVPLTGEWYTHSEYNGKDVVSSTDPFIVSCLSQVNADSMTATLQQLQDFGTRFMLADNRKEVAEWLLEKV